MIIFGIDPGIARVGYGMIDFSHSTIRCLEYGCIETFPDQSFPARLRTIDREIQSLIEEYRPDEMAFEELFFYNNHKTAIVVAQARGVEVMAGVRNAIPVYEYTPLQIKQALTGFGRATKEQMQRSVQHFLRLSELPYPDDAADGLAVAICHAFGQRFKEVNEMR